MITIDKSRFSAEQLAQYEALLAIGKADVDPEAAEKEMEEEKPFPPKKTAKTEETRKSASPELTAALERLAVLEKSYEMKEFTDIAKKYAPLGENEETLAQTLYDMKKSNEANYNAYIAILDKSLGMVEKSGMFAEIGKSTGSTTTSGGAVAKAEARARELQAADPNMDYTTALAKSWEDPEIMAEYDAEYLG